MDETAIEYELLAKKLEEGGFAFFSEGRCTAHEYIHRRIMEKCKPGDDYKKVGMAVIEQIKTEWDLKIIIRSGSE